MALVSVKLPKRKEGKSRAVAVDESPFPFGLNISLEDEVLKKLKLRKLPKVGAEVTIRAVGSVTSVNEHQSRDRSNRSVSIQIEKIEVTPAKGSAEDAVDDALSEIEN